MAVTAVQPCAYTENHWTEHVKRMTSMVCEWCLNFLKRNNPLPTLLSSRGLLCDIPIVRSRPRWPHSRAALQRPRLLPISSPGCPQHPGSPRPTAGTAGVCAELMLPHCRAHAAVAVTVWGHRPWINTHRFLGRYSHRTVSQNAGQDCWLWSQFSELGQNFCLFNETESKRMHRASPVAQW